MDAKLNMTLARPRKAKVCDCCGATKALHHFTRSTERRDGLSGACKPCQRMQHAADQQREEPPKGEPAHGRSPHRKGRQGSR